MNSEKALYSHSESGMCDMFDAKLCLHHGNSVHHISSLEFVDAKSGAQEGGCEVLLNAWLRSSSPIGMGMNDDPDFAFFVITTTTLLLL